MVASTSSLIELVLATIKMLVSTPGDRVNLPLI
jgi:hypothetical protein